LRKIPVLRLNFTRYSAREIVRLSTGIFRKYPSQTWYICSKCTVLYLYNQFCQVIYGFRSSRFTQGELFVLWLVIFFTITIKLPIFNYNLRTFAIINKIPLPSYRAPDKLRICVFYAMKTSKNAFIIRSVYTLRIHIAV
jgi:hypothetical protein